MSPKAVTNIRWLIWLAAGIAAPIWAITDAAGWDFRIYGVALQSLRAGHDPYLDATAIQRQLHAQAIAHGTANAAASAYSYVYSPITLPLLRLAGHLPHWPLIIFYTALYVAGILTTLAVGVSWSRPGAERTFALFAAAAAPFLPGLLVNESVLSGNIAYILYGLILAALVLGWRKNTFAPFYLAVFVASCIKAPLLSLALLPALSARKQWLPALITVAIGAATFLAQPHLWPSLFHHYLQAVELQFSINQDFGSSPAGLYSQYRTEHGLPYAPQAYFAYAAYALPLFSALVFLSRKYLQGHIALNDWAPILLTGVITLNPRIMEYDTAPITVPLALLAWRLASRMRRPLLALALAAVVFLAANAVAIVSWQGRKVIEGPLLALLLAASLWHLHQQARAASSSASNHPSF